MRAPSPLRGVYALVDTAQVADAPGFARAVLDGGVRLLQLRSKRGVDRRVLADLVRLVRAFDALLVVNDDIEAALTADGVHLGIEDAAALDLAAVRTALDGKILGLSCGTPAEARAAAAFAPDYIGAGPVFQTGSKADAGYPIGIAGVRAVVSAAGAPVAAIGGITRDNIARVRETGATMAAVISALTTSDDPRRSAAELIERWSA